MQADLTALNARAEALRAEILALHERARHQQPAVARRTRAKAGRLSGTLLDLNGEIVAAGGTVPR